MRPPLARAFASVPLGRGCLCFGNLLKFKQQLLVILGEIANSTAIAKELADIPVGQNQIEVVCTIGLLRDLELEAASENLVGREFVGD